MTRAAKTYIFGVIAAGAMVLAGSLASWSPTDLWLCALYMALTVAASVVKLRLPGMDGAYSLSYLFLLYGVAHLPLAETLIAGCVGVAAQSFLNAKTRHSLIQIVFNIATVAISVGASFVVGRLWLAAEIGPHLPTVMALVACVYFVVNTALVSGVLSLVENKPLGDVCRQWYLWSFPYYLIGVTLVGLVPAPGQSVSGEAWLILLPMLYLVHFLSGLVDWHASLPSSGNQANALLPRAARIYLIGVTSAGAIMLAVAGLGWQSKNPTRFFIYLALAVLASTFKIKLPGLSGTITPAFVLLLASIAQLSLAETAVMAAVVGAVQVLWRASRTPRLAQVAFNPACLAVSASLAWVLTHVALEPWLGDSVVGALVVSTLVLYGSNTIIVSAMMALVEGKPLSGIWKLCYFWSLPYYLVGAAAAGIMTATSRTVDWPPSLLVLPLMALFYVSYRAQITQAFARTEPVMA